MNIKLGKIGPFDEFGRGYRTFTLGAARTHEEELRTKLEDIIKSSFKEDTSEYHLRDYTTNQDGEYLLIEIRISGDEKDGN